LFAFWRQHPDKLPQSYQEDANSDAHGAPAQTVCDYIAGTTDNFINEQYRVLMEL